MNYLLVPYRAFVSRTRTRIAFIEDRVSLRTSPEPLSDDEEKNEPGIYAALFSDECRTDVERLYDEAMQEMRGLPFARCDNVIAGLAFLQQVVATALWKYRCVVGEKLEGFAREFDRLDVQAERQRLHARAQVT